MVFHCINIRQVPREELKTAASGLGFQHIPRDQANVNAWKNMFDPYIGTFSQAVVMHTISRTLSFIIVTFGLYYKIYPVYICLLILFALVSLRRFWNLGTVETQTFIVCRCLVFSFTFQKETWHLFLAVDVRRNINLCDLSRSIVSCLYNQCLDGANTWPPTAPMYWMRVEVFHLLSVPRIR